MDFDLSSPKPTLNYKLFVFLEELRSRKAPQLDRTNAKIELTADLISQGMDNLFDQSDDGLEILHRQIWFKVELMLKADELEYKILERKMMRKLKRRLTNR